MLGMDQEQSVRVIGRDKKRTACEMVGDEDDSYLQSPAKKISLLLEISNLIIDGSQMCDGYVTEIYDYLHNLEKEAKRRPRQDYIEMVQKDMTADYRAILVDWLVEVAEDYKLQSETIHLSIDYIDKFLSTNPVNKERLQLLGISSMLIASKFEDKNSSPTVDDFCDITDDTYPREDVVKMEADILKCLKFEVSSPTILTFFRRFSRISEEDCNYPNMEFELFGCYLAELSLLDYYLLKFLPSLIASSVVFLSRFIFHPDMHPWNANLEKCSGYKAADLKECAVFIQEIHLGKRGNYLVAIRKKYLKQKFQYVGLRKGPPEIPSSYFEEMVVSESF